MVRNRQCSKKGSRQDKATKWRSHKWSPGITGLHADPCHGTQRVSEESGRRANDSMFLRPVADKSNGTFVAVTG
jgi:hypothetical protein